MNSVREAIAGLSEALGYAYPILVLQLIVLALHPSGTSALLALLALLFSLAHAIGLFAECSVIRLSCVVKLLQRFPNSHFDVADHDRLEAAELTDLKRLTVVVVQPGGGDNPLGSLVSHYSFFGSSYVFLRDAVDDLSAYDRFALFHELAHTSEISRSDLIAEMARSAWMWQLAWVFLFAQWNGTMAAALGLLIVSQIVFRYEWDLWPASFSTLLLRSETTADRLALLRLSPSELQELRGDFVDSPRLDPGLIGSPPHRGNEFRNFMLLRVIDGILKEGTDSVSPSTGMLSEGTTLRNLLTLAAIALLGQSFKPWKLWVALAVVVLLGLSARFAVRRALGMDHWCRQKIFSQSKAGAAGGSHS
jgi:hypothetical protein